MYAEPEAAWVLLNILVFVSKFDLQEMLSRFLRSLDFIIVDSVIS